MAHMIIRHKIADFDKWKPLFDAHRPVREAAGINDLHLWRNADDLSDVVLLSEISDLAKAKEFAAAPELKEKMQDAGVLGAPDIIFLSGD